jgi:hypothetical protein
MSEAAEKCTTEGEGSGPHLAAPMVAGGLISTYRASMIERDLWDHVRATLSASSACATHGTAELDWVDGKAPPEWVELDHFVALIEAIGATLGPNELRTLVRRRIVDPSGSSFYAPMLRSWARSFGASAGHMLRGAVHVWRAAVRNVGTLKPVDVRPGEVHLVVEGPAAEAYRRSPALAASFEGLALGVLDLSQPRPVFVEVELVARRDPVALVCRFHS